MELDTVDKKILVALQGDLDDSPEPYEKMAFELGITQDEVIRRIKRLLDEGVIRRIGAMIRHIEAGIGFNGMVVWKVDPQCIEDVGNKLAAFREVTHCYERPPFGEKGGVLFTMVHAASEEGCMDIIKRMSEETGVKYYEILFSERELKKVSMTYFDEEES
ncbi:MAG: Lrp/AsnC family transcriptional regulator [Desulfomonile tiedjei]|uniref:siroheme decarboxylase n=1 Tax=Desulfomonile tiedjei TaxID=2358 RepID=A0A9D6V2L7_9BACT|nr:Lrp/AsnC family transcriptional regulator [Desulfomonile tiedjei]